MLTLNMLGACGDVEITFETDQVVIDWRKSPRVERTALKALIVKAKENGFETFDDEGEKTDELPSDGHFGSKEGKIILKGKPSQLKFVAEGIIEQEIKNGKLVMQANEDGSWNILRQGEFKSEPEKKQKVVSSEKVAGG